MVKLVGVIGSEHEREATPPSTCSASRQLPLNVEPDLTMIMAVDDYCMACGIDPCGRGKRYLHNHDWCNFLRNYRSLDKDEVIACLKATPEEVITTLKHMVTCVGCRRSVEALYESLILSGHSALEPLSIDEDGAVCINKEHGNMEDILANLFCCQVRRLTKELVVSQEMKSGKGGRCAQHSLGVKKHEKKNKLFNLENWFDIWDCMVTECKEEVVLIPCTLLRQTLDNYLKKNRFCCDCKSMVNRAYTLLVKDGKEPLIAIGGKCPNNSPHLNNDGTENLYGGINVCTTELHIHVKCDTEFIRKLFLPLEAEFSNIKQERHAKTIEQAQQELLVCIGLALFQRLQRIQQKLSEAENTRDLLFLTVVKTLKKNLDIAADKKKGLKDLDLLCQEIEGGEKCKEGKRERKKKQRAKRKESKNVIEVEEKINVEEEQLNSKEDDSINEDNEKKEKECEDCCDFQNIEKLPAKYGKQADNTVQSNGIHMKQMYQKTLEDLLEEDNGEGAVVPKEDITTYLARKEEIETRRRQLREDLRTKFAQLCVTGLTPCSARK